MRHPEEIAGRAAEAPCSRRALLLGGAMLAAAAALTRSYSGFDLFALILMTSAWLAALAAAMGPRTAAQEASRLGALRVAFAVALVGSCAYHLFFAPGLYLHPARPLAFRAVAAAAALIAATYLVRIPAALRRWRFPALAAAFLAMAVIVVRASPQPFIDVYWFQQLAAAGFLRGQNPYQLTYPNLYGDARFYGPGILDQHGAVSIFPYPPLTFLLGVPGYLLGDVRFMLFALTAVAAVALSRLGKGETPELAAALLLLHPRSFLVVEQAWTEPIVLAAAGLTVLAMRAALRNTRGGAVRVGVSGGLLAASKQFSPVFVLPLAFALPRAIRRSSRARSCSRRCCPGRSGILPSCGGTWCRCCSS